MMKVDRRMNNEIIGLATPVVVGMISHTVLNIVDTAMVGRLGDTAIASVGLASYLTIVLVLIFGSLNVGTQAITARRLGEKKSEDFSMIIYNAFFLALVTGISVSIIGYLLSSRIFKLLSDNTEIIREGTSYLAIRFLGLFSMIIVFTMKGFIYGLARTRIDMVVSLIINILNMVLNYFLIFGNWIFPRMEVRGAAIASVASTMVGLLIYILFINFRILRPLPAHHRLKGLSRKLMGAIIKISLPRSLQSISILGFVIFLKLIGRLGVQELAISNIIFKAFNLSFMIGIAIGTASATLVGRSLGEGNKSLASKYGWHSVGMGSILMGIIGALFMFFPREIMGIFTRAPVTIEKGVLPFRLLGAFQLLDGIGIILSRTLQGIGSTLYVMVSEIICIFCVLVPSTYMAIEVLDGGLVLAWCGLFLYIICFSSAMTWMFRKGRWKHVQV